MTKRKKFTKSERQQIYDMFNGHCAYCGYDKFSITTSGTNYFPIHCFEYVKIVDNGITVIKDGEWGDIK